MTTCSPATFFSEEPVHFQCGPVQTGFTMNEIQELLSLLQCPNSGSEDGSNRAVYSVDERKRRRMTSNRESARRSRWRKKRHLENLTSEVNRLEVEKRELKNQLGLVSHKCQLVWRENDQLESESLALWARLSDLCRILVAMQSQ